MLKITIPASELFDEATSKFITTEEISLELEHSLVSLSKWEQIWEKPFLGKDERTDEQTLDYIRCMTLSPEDLSLNVFRSIPQNVMNQITHYINAKMTATWFNDIPGQVNSNSSETITAEVMYYWLIALQIPFEVQYWHLNRLLTLLRVTNIKNDPKKKMMPKADAAAQQRMLNEQRRIEFNSKG
jgi:hypothetical protein